MIYLAKLYMIEIWAGVVHSSVWFDMERPRDIWDLSNFPVNIDNSTDTVLDS